MRLRVIFSYDPDSKKWDPEVQGAESPVEARQAFNAVLLTMRMLDEALFNHHRVLVNTDQNYTIVPAVRGTN